jgi:tetratricopeptide (TPR) repeat protein
VERYRSALDIDPEMMSVHYNLANALRRLERSEESVEHYRKIIDQDPGNEAARLGEIFALVRLGRRAEALQRLEQGHEALPESGQIRNALARLLAAAPEDVLRDGPRALALAEGLVEAHRALPFVVTLAMAAAEARDFPLALEWQQAAIEAVRQSGNNALLPELEANLALYRANRPCRVPWREDDPLLSPRPRR